MERPRALFATKQKHADKTATFSFAFGQLPMFSNEIEPIVNTTEKGGLKEGDVMMKRLNEAVMRINVIK